jgi:hypothetical protein
VNHAKSRESRESRESKVCRHLGPGASEAAFSGTTEDRPDVSQMARVSVDITYCECRFRCLLDFFQLIGSSLNSEFVAQADELIQLINIGVTDSFKTAQFSLRHRCLPLLAVRLRNPAQRKMDSS